MADFFLNFEFFIFYLKLFFIFLNYFNILYYKLFFKKKIYYFNKFSSKKYFKTTIITISNTLVIKLLVIDLI